MNTTEQSLIENEAFLSEDYFQKMLINERKRTERFGRPFMLVLLDVGQLLNDKWNERGVLLQNLAVALNSSTREIDLKGWYMHKKLLGILCPEVTMTEKNWIIDEIRQKLKTFLEPNEAAAIKMHCLFYPNIEEEQSAGAKDTEIDELRPEWRGFFHS